MSRTQSPTRFQVDMNILAEKLLQVCDRLKALEESRPTQPMTTNAQPAPVDDTPGNYTIGRYDQCLPLIPDFDGNNTEVFISTLIKVSSMLHPEQHALLLLAIISQKLKGRAASTIRPDTITSIPKLIEKIRFMYGKTVDTSALKTKRDVCKQRSNEPINDFIQRFSQIQDELITAINTERRLQSYIDIKEIICNEEGIQCFRRNVRPEISQYLFSQQLETLNQAFEAARMYDMELQYMQQQARTLQPPREPRRVIEHRPVIQRYPVPDWRSMECTYCRRRGHTEPECRTKQRDQPRRPSEQQRNFRWAPPNTQPPDGRSPSGTPGQPQQRSIVWTRPRLFD
ncbi:uncharacterized protein LOC143264053 [Megachile rotundata]|uniref:uncharacterized protein LOC143264053 n=1 Tax=Megachile rotundata TaxID=143995 RepID=UPI003FD22686